MKQLTCEMCGSTDLMKQDGVFVCQTCGCKYSVEEARKMMVEGTVEVQGAVQVVNTAQVSSLLNMAKSSFDSKNYAKAEEFCNQIIAMDDKNYEAWKLKGEAINYQINAKNPRILEVYNCIMTSYRVLPADMEESERLDKKAEITKALKTCMEGEVDFWLDQFEAGRPTDEALRRVKSTYVDCYNKMKAAYEEMGYETEEYLKNFDNHFCIKSNSVCFDAWDSTVAYNYFRDDLKNMGLLWTRGTYGEESRMWGTRVFRPNEEIRKTFVEETDNLIALLEYCTEQFNDLTPLWVKNNIYSNISYFYETPIDQVSYKPMEETTTNGYGAVVKREEFYKIDKYMYSGDKEARRKKADAYEKLHQKIQAELDRIEQEEKEKRVCAYWEAHAEEKQKLEAEKEAIPSQMESVKSSAIEQEKQQKQLRDTLPEIRQIADLDERISTLTAYRDSLSFFKMKEKKLTQEQIDDLTAERAEVRNRLEKEKKKIESAIQSIRDKKKNKLAALQERLDAIDEELTKDREEKQA